MKRTVKIFLIFTAAFLTLIFLVLIGFRIYYSDNRIRALVNDYIKESTDSEVAIENLETHGFISITIDDLKLTNEVSDSVWLKLSNIKISIRPLRLLRREIYISDITIKDLLINYDQFPAPTSDSAGISEPSKAAPPPFDIVSDRLAIENLTLSGPEADVNLDILITDLFFRGSNDFSATYSMKSNRGKIHYFDETFSVGAICEISAAGTIGSNDNLPQNFKASLGDIICYTSDSMRIDKLAVELETVSNLRKNIIDIQNLSFELNGKEELAFTGRIDLKENPAIFLEAGNRSWDLERLNPILSYLDIPVDIYGSLSLQELSLFGSRTYFSYDLAMDLANIDIEYDGMINLGGLRGEVYSSGDPGTFAFGSSLYADSVAVKSDSAQLLSVHELSSAVEAEISGSELYVNITAGVADFLGGDFDMSAFTESSKIEGDLNIENVSLSRAISGFPASENIDFSGLIDMALKVSGRLDSIQSDLSASLAELKIKLEEDSLYIPKQDFKISASTVLKDKSIDSRFAYDVRNTMSGNGDLHYPLKAESPDSIVMSYRLNLDNSALPSYLPSAILSVLGTVELSGGSVVDGRFTSPPDTLIFTGSSKLTIDPTDILISDFQSVLFSLISVSELEVNRKGVSIFSSSGIEDIINENYSDLKFSGVTIQGEIVSLTDTTWRITNMNITIPSLRTQLDLLGDFGYSGDSPFSNLTLYITFDSDEPVEIGYRLFLKGKIRGELKAGTADTLLEYSGKTELRSVEIESLGVFKCFEIDGEIPFSGTIDLRDSMFVAKDFTREVPGSGYQRARLANMLAGEYGRLRIGRIEADPFYIFDLNVDTGFRGGVFDISHLTGEILGGNFFGMLRADLTGINLMREIPNFEALRYNLDLELSNLDFNQLTYNMGPFSQRADFAADAHFNGSGIIAPDEEYSVSGSLHITKMGPGVALRVLDIMDPENSNPGIMQTRALLNRKLLGLIDLSYKPKNFSFELKHGSLYPRLFMDQPFFADVVPLVRVPMPVEYGRIPVKSLLANLKEESW